jgi:hypothetical protein
LRRPRPAARPSATPETPTFREGINGDANVPEEPTLATGTEPPRQRGGLQTARFIQRDINETKVTLGADGQLPDLALTTHENRDDAASESTASNPWVLIVVLCGSVLMSLAMLLIDEPGGTSSAAKADTHTQLQQIFAGWEAPAEPEAAKMRGLLARALQAHNRGDEAEERELYRQLLDLLNREDAPKYGGFSGEDEQLHELLNDLLR